MATKEQLNFSKMSQRNTLLFILSRLDLTAMVLPIIVLIWRNAGLTFNQMLFLQGIFALFIVIFEIPSGAISDTFQRKHVLATGYAMLAFASFIYYLSHNFIGFAIAESTFGIGRATISGSDTSLLYDTLVLSNETKKFKRIMGRSIGLSLFVASVSLLISGWIATHNLRLPLLLMAFSFCIRVFLCIMMIEPYRMKASNIKKATMGSVKLLLSKHVLIAILFATLSAAVVQRVVFWAFQPKLLENGLNSFYIGLLFASFNVIAVIGSLTIPRIKDKHEDIVLLIILLSENIHTFVVWHFNNLIILSTIGAFFVHC